MGRPAAENKRPINEKPSFMAVIPESLLRLRAKGVYSELFYFGLVLMMISLPLSRFGMSVAQFLLAGAWLLEGDLRSKWQRIRHNSPAIIFISLFILHLAGLIHTSDFEYGFKDIRTKLPLLILPLLLVSASPISGSRMILLWWFYIGAILAGTLISASLLLFRDITDTRQIFPFISHIRFSLNLCIGFFAALYLFLKHYRTNRRIQTILFLIMGWMFFFLLISGSLTGLSILAIVFAGFAVAALLSVRNIYKRLTAAAVLLVAVILAGFYVHDIVKSYHTPYLSDTSGLEEFSPSGSRYVHDTVGWPVESGRYSGLYIASGELRETWNRRSNLDYDGEDLRGQPLSGTLIRYLSSKGLRKDSAGVAQLTEKDIGAIEKGVANVEYLNKFSFRPRIYSMIWEYDSYRRGGNPGGHTLMQRMEFWKASVGIITDNFWFGVGTGDVQQAFDRQYKEMDSPLKPELRWRAHNQFLAIFIAFGLFGFLWFVFTLIYPPLKTGRIKDFLYTVFFAIILLSMMTEDTLETQAGATLFAFMNAFLLFNRKETNAEVNDPDSGSG